MPARPPRSRAQLEGLIAAAPTNAKRALAEFNLAVFHDNNSREKEAIPHYRAALKLGLPPQQTAECLAWLASSLLKTGKLDQAKARLADARAATADPGLLKFLDGLERRIGRAEFDASLRQIAAK